VCWNTAAVSLGGLEGDWPVPCVGGGQRLSLGWRCASGRIGLMSLMNPPQGSIRSQDTFWQKLIDLSRADLLNDLPLDPLHQRASVRTAFSLMHAGRGAVSEHPAGLGEATRRGHAWRRPSSATWREASGAPDPRWFLRPPGCSNHRAIAIGNGRIRLQRPWASSTRREALELIRDPDRITRPCWQACFLEVVESPWQAMGCPRTAYAVLDRDDNHDGRGLYALNSGGSR